VGLFNKQKKGQPNLLMEFLANKKARLERRKLLDQKLSEMKVARMTREEKRRAQIKASPYRLAA
jgi:hypothetical protein